MDAGPAGRQRLHCHHVDQDHGQHGDEVLLHDIIEQLPISVKNFHFFKTSQNQCHGRKQLKASRVCNFRGF